MRDPGGRRRRDGDSYIREMPEKLRGIYHSSSSKLKVSESSRVSGVRPLRNWRFPSVIARTCAILAGKHENYRGAGSGGGLRRFSAERRGCIHERGDQAGTEHLPHTQRRPDSKGEYRTCREWRIKAVLQVQEGIEIGAYESIPGNQRINLFEILGDQFPTEVVNNLQQQIDQVGRS